MVITTIDVKPYLEAYMYVRYHNDVLPEFNAIKLKCTEDLYHAIKNLTVRHPKIVSWKETNKHTSLA